jgi:hypothetical protein
MPPCMPTGKRTLLDGRLETLYIQSAASQPYLVLLVLLTGFGLTGNSSSRVAGIEWAALGLHAVIRSSIRIYSDD